ncbi:sulfotransferase [Sandarakinorhabdus sp. AAP62]|uniref:sulfotransferase n=1 Tax=Sandarakinorhabdus sp. AAP62 TaxID=1248916 RepID=UPI0002E44AC2|nr:sulfotransferase [Sandarakinorhabdus sp. AAP62]
MATLDFVVGGIPRGGTTAFADAFNRHPDIYCHASESHLIEFALQMAGQRPVSAAALPAVRAELRRCLQVNLIELVEFNLHMGSPEPPLRFGEADLDLLADEMAATLGRDFKGLDCADQLSAILARELRRRSGKPLVGEKTPSNALALDQLGWRRAPTNAAPLFVVVRRPFAVIRSMQARLANPIDLFAAEYSGSIAEMAGYYARHALACARLLRAGARLCRYEDLSGNPHLAFRQALQVIGVAASDRIVHDLAQTIQYRGRDTSRSGFAAEEQALIDAITQPALDQLGYGRDPASQADAVSLDCGGQVIAGRHPDGWLEQRSVLMLVAQPHHRRALLEIWHRFPAAIVGAHSQVHWSVEATDGRILASGRAVGGDEAMIELAIAVDPATWHHCANGNLLLVAELRCTHAQVPMAHADEPDGASLDVRALSGQLRHVAFD